VPKHPEPAVEIVSIFLEKMGIVINILQNDKCFFAAFTFCRMIIRLGWGEGEGNYRKLLRASQLSGNYSYNNTLQV
jgi:hypothetical protein